MSTIFFGYPSRPETSRETLERAASALRERFGLDVGSWEDLSIGGRVLIEEIAQAIDAAEVSVFDVTTLNENVLFELGYAIGADKRIWLLRDTSDERAAERWEQTPLLHTVGYREYINAEDVVSAYMADQPHADSDTFFSRSIEPQLGTPSEPTLFYAKAPLPTEAEREISRRLRRERREGIRVIEANPQEAASNTLPWYANHCYLASVVVVHMLGRNRRGAGVHNARCALIAGLARGFGRQVLMLVEEGHWSALDYRDLLYEYGSARDCRDRVDAWLPRALTGAKREVERRAEVAERRVLSTELAAVRLGEYVAENESDELLRYFVSTAPYRDALEPGTTIFLGRKGTGKTANFICAADELSTDRRNLVCVIQPTEYDLGGIAQILEAFDAGGDASYLVETLWKYLLITELAVAAVDAALQRPAGMQPSDPEWPIDEYLRAQSFSADFAVRLERAVASLATIDSDGALEQRRGSVAQALHEGEIHALREMLQPVLSDKKRVAFLIDNLDQAWAVERDRAAVSRLLLGLLGAAERLVGDLRKIGTGGVGVSLVVFLRSDIFVALEPALPEPDKLPIRRLLWSDQAMLLQIPEERFSVARAGQPGQDLWKYFDDAVGGVPTTDYICQRVQPRPRDILHYCRSAIDSAVMHRRVRVTEADLLAADAEYSRFATGVLLVELGEDLEAAVYAFAGSDPVVSPEVLGARLREAGVLEPDAENAVEQLLAATFLGIEVVDGDFTYAQDPGDLRRFKAMSRALGNRRHSPARYKVHPAYHSYLGMSDSSDPQMAFA
jgi:hypothetical protein